MSLFWSKFSKWRSCFGVLKYVVSLSLTNLRHVSLVGWKRVWNLIIPLYKVNILSCFSAFSFSMPWEISLFIISSNICDLFKQTQYSFAKSFKFTSISWSSSIFAAPISVPVDSLFTMKWRNFFSSSNSLVYVFFNAFLTDLLDFSILNSL